MATASAGAATTAATAATADTATAVAKPKPMKPMPKPKEQNEPQPHPPTKELLGFSFDMFGLVSWRTTCLTNLNVLVQRNAPSIYHIETNDLHLH